jgi:predicted nucleic acid-binding protein
VILVDTSIWIEVFRKRNPLRIQSVLEFDEIVTCLPVIQEVLQGFREERAYRAARDAMTALPILESPMEEPLFVEAAGLSLSLGPATGPHHQVFRGLPHCSLCVAA